MKLHRNRLSVYLRERFRFFGVMSAEIGNCINIRVKRSIYNGIYSRDSRKVFQSKDACSPLRALCFRVVILLKRFSHVGMFYRRW